VPTVNLDIRQLPWQAKVYRELVRFNVLTKGRRTGGTSFAEDLCLEHVLGGKRIGWFFDTYKRLSEVWRDLVRALHPLLRQVNTNEHRIELKTDGVIQFFSCESKLTCRGFKFDWVIITESAHIPNFQETWETEIYPTLFDTHGRALFESSPNGYNFHQKLHDRGQDPKFPDWKSWQIPTTENPLISKSEIETAAATMDEGNFRQEIGAEFVTRAGAVFPMFRRAEHVTEEAEYDPQLPLLMGVDFGLRTAAIGFWQVIWSQGEAHCIGEVEGKEEVTEAALLKAREYACEMWFSQNANGREPVDYFLQALRTIGCDPAGGARNIQTKKTDVDILRATFPRVAVAARMPQEYRDPIEGAKMLRAMLKSASGKVRLFIHPRCRHHIRMFENLIHPKHTEGKPEKEEIVKDGVNDHWFDQTRYILANALWGARKPLWFRP
jgi:hypothetical protein